MTSNHCEYLILFIITCGSALLNGEIPSRNIEKTLDQNFPRGSTSAKHQAVPLQKHEESYLCLNNTFIFLILSVTQICVLQIDRVSTRDRGTKLKN